ncbi:MULTISPECIES: 4'-phosphopantetheinyl transferase family protein [unclassified Streptomyces]|uniref:4'-phosphopantetheinyl transferase family protein n=1 Tax=unclassified Streptomyces TaxID=2593676 RepID=UPI003D715A49
MPTLLSPRPSAPALAHGEIHVWSVPLDRVRLDADDSVLSPHERARAARFRRPAGRTRYRSAHLALRTLLAGYLGVPPHVPRWARRCPEPEVCGGCGAGRPVLLTGPWPQLEFSLSHSGAAALVGLVRAPGTVGVDVERVRPAFDWSRLPQVGPQSRVAGFRTWTAVEAVGKAAGTGLRDPVSVGPPRTGRPRRARRSGDPADWYVHEVRCPDGYVGSVATSTPDAVVRSFLWPMSGSGSGCEMGACSH